MNGCLINKEDGFIVVLAQALLSHCNLIEILSSVIGKYANRRQ
jgi:hypothetical protein